MINVNSQILELNKKVLSNFEKLCDEVYIYRSMLTKEECEKVILEAKKDETPELFFSTNKESEFDKPWEQETNSRYGKWRPKSYSTLKTPYHAGKFKTSLLDQYRIRFLNLLNYEDQNLILKNNVENESSWDFCMLRVNNDGDPVHVDIYEYQDIALNDVSLTKNKIKKEKIALPFATTILYLSEDFDGGEIYYPEYDLLYKPKAGDLIVFNSQIVHSVKPISNGERWNHQNSISSLFFISDEVAKTYAEKQKGWGSVENEIKTIGKKGVHEKNKSDERFFYRIDQNPVKHKRLIAYAEKNNIDLKTYGLTN